MAYDDEGGFFGGLGGLGGLSGGLNGFMTNPLTLAAFQMMSNNSPSVGKPVDTFNGVADTLLKAGVVKKKADDDAASKKAMMDALVGAGLSQSEAAVYSKNPAAAHL